MTFLACIRNRGGKEIGAGSPVRLKMSEIWSKLGKAFLFRNLEVVFPVQDSRKIRLEVGGQRRRKRREK